MQFQLMHFQPLTISTYCIFNRPLFRPKLIFANGSYFSVAFDKTATAELH